MGMIAFKFKWSAIGLATAVFATAPLVHAAAVPGQGTWETTLQGRDLDGNAANGFEAYYDTALNITWLADVNFAQTSGYTSASYGGVTPGSAYNTHVKWTDGRMGWDAANTWATNLNVSGLTGWRLPATVDTGTPGCNRANGGTDCGYNPSTSTSEMAHMYYVTLANKAVTSASGSFQSDAGLKNTGPFSNVQSNYYWSGVDYSPDANLAWDFYLDQGYQDFHFKGNVFYAWAVRTGDVAAVPEPEGYGLALLGLTLVGVAARRRYR